MGFRPFFRKSKKSTVTKIVRDSYGKPADWFGIAKRVKVRDNYQCVACKCKESPKEGVYLDVHHIRELSRGGKTVMSNLISLCRRCHKLRHRHM